MTKKILLGVAVFAIVFFSGYEACNNVWEKKYSEFQLKAEQDYSTLLKAKIENDKQNRERIATIETDSIKQLNDQKVSYEKIITDMRANFKPSGVFKCPSSDDSMPRSSGNTPESICYSQSELQRKIEQSLAIGYECDQLAVKYNSLLKILK